MVHFGPLAGRTQTPGLTALIKKARADLTALQTGGVSAIMFENMYDQPHTERLDKRRVQEFAAIMCVVRSAVRVPFGLSLLWNDYPQAFHLARQFGAGWVRIPVFVDSVQTAYGRFVARPRDVIASRRRERAEVVNIMVDVQVKHSTMLNPRSIVSSAQASIRAGADALIVTGKWIGDPPKISDLRRVRSVAGQTPIFTGSGLTSSNVGEYLPYIHGAIVGTAFKRGGAVPKSKHLMRSPWDRSLAVSRIKRFMAAVRSTQR